MKTDFELLKKCGYEFENEEALHYRMVDLIDFLCCHNKNYTKAQEYAIFELKDIIKCMEVENA